MIGAVKRLAIAYGYLGDSFHGSQYQPNHVTAQGTLEEVIAELTWGDPPSEGNHSLRNASRTDAGVHVRMNVAMLEVSDELWSKLNPKNIVNAMNDHLPETIWVWGAAKAPENWNPRHPISRTYRYRLEGSEFWPGVEINELEEWLQIFQGTHDFVNFSRPEGEGKTIRTVEKISPWVEGSHIIGFEIKGPSFVWNQVRRIASAIEFLARGKTTVEEVSDSLNNPKGFVDLGLSEPDFLILWELEYEEISFHQIDCDNSSLSRRIYDSSFREQQHWCEVAKNEMRMLVHRQGLNLRLANN